MSTRISLSLAAAAAIATCAVATTTFAQDAAQDPARPLPSQAPAPQLPASSPATTPSSAGTPSTPSTGTPSPSSTGTPSSAGTSSTGTASSTGTPSTTPSSTSTSPNLSPQPPPWSPTPATSATTEPAAVAPPATVSTTSTTQGAYMTSSDRIVEEERHDRPNKKLLVTGGSLFLLSYVPSVLVAAQSDREADNRLYIPVVGPWLDLGQRNCDVNPCGGSEGVAKAFIIASGAVQGIGVLTALSSLVIPERERVQVRKSASAATKPEVHVTPVSFVGGGGLGAVGRF